MLSNKKTAEIIVKSAVLWYNICMQKTYFTAYDYTTVQLKLQLDFEKIIEISDPIYSFNEIMNQIDLRKYFVRKENKMGRPRFDSVKMLKIILFAFMENGYASLRNIEKLCKTDVRFIWLLDDTKAPTFMTVSNFINDFLVDSIEDIFNDINRVIFKTEKVDLNHVYIDGTKIEANSNKYTWVWKKSCLRNRDKVFLKLTDLITEINETDLIFQCVRIGTRTEYDILYLSDVIEKYSKIMNIDTSTFVYGSGRRKSTVQKHYEKLNEYYERLKEYAKRISICGDKRNSYSKTDTDATFLRVKNDYMGNGQLLPAYNIQLGICDEYIAVSDVKQYASDMECFVPLMEKFNGIYGFYPKYPVADAGYGNYNNYLYCEEKGMEKYMKFTMYEKETKSEKYHNNPFRAVNFKRNENGNLVCPNGKEFHYLYVKPVRGNKFGRTEEYYQCEDCSNCQYREQCHKSKQNRIIRINEELTSFHIEVLSNLNCIHGALLRMNRSIQSEGTYGVIKNDRGYRRIQRRGIKSVNFEIVTICCGFNLKKYHSKKMRALNTAA